VYNFAHFIEQLRLISITKSVLKLSASIYDPLGFLCPITSRLKAIFQMLCKDKLDWDTDVPPDVKTVWEDLLQSIEKIQVLRLPRLVLTDSVKSIEMHGFSDSSQEVYCGVIYLRIITKTAIHSNFLCAKSKVAPIKQISIPRLELLGCELLSKLIRDVGRAMDGRLEISKIFCWTDSQVALYWIKGREKDWKPWIGNRVVRIREVVSLEDWKHVHGQLNPADIPKLLIKFV